MTTLVSAATGNLTAAATWKVVDATSHINSMEASTANTTSYVASLTFTPGAITIDGIGVLVASRIASPVGTYSVELYNNTTAASIVSVTVNVSDLAAGPSWYMFPVASTLLVAGNVYVIRVKCSVASEVTTYRNASSGNWSRMLRTTTTAAPAANDDLHIMGEHTGIGMGNDIAATMDDTSGTSYGSVVANSPRITISKRGSLVVSRTGGLTLRFKHKGQMAVFGGGVLDEGTQASPIPNTSTYSHELDVVVHNDTGLVVYSGGTHYSNGTLNSNVHRAMLNADVSAAGTVLITDVTTGWKSGDRIAVAPTTRTVAEWESRTLSIDASGTTVTLSSGLTYAHSGTATRQAEIVLLTRNVRMFGTSRALAGYVYYKTGHIAETHLTAHYYLGTNTGTNRGVYIEASTVTSIHEDNSYYDYYNGATGASGIFLATVANINVRIKNCDFVDAGYVPLYSSATTSVTSSIEEPWIIGVGVTTSYGMLVNTAGMSVLNPRVSGCAASVNLTGSTMIKLGTVSNILAHSCSGGPVVSGIADSLIGSITSWRTNGQGVTMTGCNNTWIGTIESVGHLSSSLAIGGNSGGGVLSIVGKGETGYTQPYSAYITGNNPGTIVADAVLGGAGAPEAATNGDLVHTLSLTDLTFHNSQFLSPTEHFPSVWGGGNSYRSEKHEGVAGANKWVMWEGTMSRDTTIYDSGTSSMRMTPTQANFKLHGPLIDSAVVSGATRTVTIKVRKSVAGDGTAYNGNQPRLIVKANPVAGITTDTVLATAVGAAGSWETLTGTTASVAESTKLQFFIDCDGTTGWINVDTVSLANDDMSSLEIYADGTPYVTGAADASNFTDIPVDKVENGYAWKYDNGTNNRTGTRVQPTEATVQIGVTYGPSSSLTGTCDGSDRWTDPGIANVRLGTAYKANSLTNNMTGNVVEPSTAVVQSGITFGSLSSLTGTLVSPSSGDITAAVIAALNTAMLPVNLKKINDANVLGDGTFFNRWRG